MVNRVLRDDPSKSDMHNRQGLSFRMIFDAVRDWRMWPLYVLGMLHMGKVSLLMKVEPCFLSNALFIIQFRCNHRRTT